MDMQLEEGELSDTSDENEIDPYKPNERPILHYEPPSVFKRDDSPTMEDAVASSNRIKPPAILQSDSDSDDECVSTKRLKLAPPIKNKYTIWNKDPNGDLTDILNQCGMDEKRAPDMCRNVENYPLPFDVSYIDNGTSTVPSRRRKIAINRRNSFEQKQQLPKKARNLDSLIVNESNTIEEVAEDITQKLNEYNEELILRIVIVLGKDKAIELYEKARVIESLGGMYINNGSRKRTSGGVFIFLVRGDKELSEDKLKAIFEKDTLQQKKIRKAMRKIKKKHRTKLGKTKNKEDSSELSNPPPSPVLPDSPLRRDVLTELADLDKQNDISQLQDIVDEDEDDVISCEEMDSPELV